MDEDLVDDLGVLDRYYVAVQPKPGYLLVSVRYLFGGSKPLLKGHTGVHGRWSTLGLAAHCRRNLIYGNPVA
ncbi:MAG: hypothetical protein ACE5JD_17675 [Candidatus Methylomirabilia bacterium]